MKTPLAWHNLVHNKMRTATAVAGVTFAVVLIFLQLGFLAAARETANIIYGALDFDLLIRSVRYRCLSDSRHFPRTRLSQAASVAGVAKVSPFYVGANQWRNPLTGRKRRILTMGARPGDHAFALEEIQQQVGRLTVPEFVLVDRKSHPDFGPRDGRQFGDGDLGRSAEVAQQRVRIVGHFLLGSGFEADGSIVLCDRGFCRITPGRSPDDTSLGLVKLASGADLQDTEARLRRVLPKDVQVLSRQEVLDIERQIWVREMSIGIIFQLGVAVAMVVGTAIVYQILSSDVTNHLPEYATLKAVGYSSAFLGRVVIEQAMFLAVLGFVPGLVIADLLYRLTEYKTNLPVDMTPGRVLFVFVLAVSMCTLSGLGAVRKVAQADPADLF